MYNIKKNQYFVLDKFPLDVSSYVMLCAVKTIQYHTVSEYQFRSIHACVTEIFALIKKGIQ